MSTIRKVQADPGGRVRLTFWPGGWTVGREPEPKLDVEQWLGVWFVGLILFAGVVHAVFHQAWLGWIFVGASGLCLLALIVLGVGQLIGTVVGAAWLAGYAMSRRGRRKLRDSARQLWAQVAADRGEYQVAAAQVRGVQVTRGFAGTTVVAVQMADGTVQRYTSWRSRTALAAAFG